MFKRYINCSTINLFVLLNVFSFASYFMSYATSQPNVHTLRLLAVGDVLLHMPLIQYAKEGDSYHFDKIFTPIAPVLKGYDVAFYNQESIIGGGDKFSGYPCFNAPPQIGETMLRLGFNIVSLANNHTLDKNVQGVLHSVAFWKEKDIAAIGSYANELDSKKPFIQCKNGITYAFFAYTTLTNREVPIDKPYLLNTFSKEKVKRDIEHVRPLVDIIIVSIHWGIEYQNLPSKEQQVIAGYLADLGVDIVFGHHPHVIQPIVQIKNTLVVYSLGNFLSSQSTADRLTGMIFTVEIEKVKDEARPTAITIHKPRVLLTYNYHSPQCAYYTIYPYAALDDTIVPGCRELYDKYKSLLVARYPGIEVYSLSNELLQTSG
jgi:2',3'-cyclic-nucleotide 2'-phosphodiesterase (5'-nucleotidase family)